VIHNASTHHEDNVQTFDQEKLAQALNLSLVAPAILNGALSEMEYICALRAWRWVSDIEHNVELI